ncbi:MAG: cytochrome P450 [Acidimicrobiia bacterium]
MTTQPVGFNPFDPTTIADPYPAYARVLEEPNPIPADFPSAWVVSHWEDVRRILGDRSFSADRDRATIVQIMPETTGDPELDEKLTLFDRMLLTLDPPTHTRLRRLVGHAFTPRRIAEMEERISVIATELVEEMREEGEGADLVKRFAYPLPVIVISELLGLPAEDREDLKQWSDDVALLLEPLPAPDALTRFGATSDEFRAYLDHQFDHRRRHQFDDLIGALVAARDGQDSLDDDELFALVVLLVAAGHETTTNLIGNSVIALTRNPDQRRRLAADPGMALRAVEELLRYDSPVQRTSRVATEPADFGEVTMQPGDLAVLLLGAANHDPTAFEDPGRLDLTRANASSHLSFGHGIHFCLGAPLARLEGRIALNALLAAFPNLEADVSNLAWKPSLVLRGVESLPVFWG